MTGRRDGSSKLHGADLSGANLYGAELNGANLSGADLHSGPEVVLAVVEHDRQARPFVDADLEQQVRPSISRILASVRFSWSGRRRVFPREFIRRFLLHVLPKGFIASATTDCWPAPAAKPISHALEN